MGEAETVSEGGSEQEELDQSASAEPESQQDPESMKPESEEPEDAQVQQVISYLIVATCKNLLSG